MSFVEWYEEKYKNKWHEDYALLYGLELIDEYEDYCKLTNTKPVWNG